MAAPIFKGAGATKAVFTKVSGSPTGAPAFHRMVEVYFPSLAALHAFERIEPAIRPNQPALGIEDGVQHVGRAPAQKVLILGVMFDRFA